jgi:hypothetical protein
MPAHVDIVMVLPAIRMGITQKVPTFLGIARREKGTTPR